MGRMVTESRRSAGARRTDLAVSFPRWIRRLPDLALRLVVGEAIAARDAAIRFGAVQSAQARRVIEAADRKIEAIAFGEVLGDAARRKAAAALRAYDRAFDVVCLRPADKRLRRHERASDPLPDE